MAVDLFQFVAIPSVSETTEDEESSRNKFHVTGLLMKSKGTSQHSQLRKL